MLAALICGAALGLNNVDPSPHGVLSSQTASDPAAENETTAASTSRRRGSIAQYALEKSRTRRVELVQNWGEDLMNIFKHSSSQGDQQQGEQQQGEEKQGEEKQGEEKQGEEKQSTQQQGQQQSQSPQSQQQAAVKMAAERVREESQTTVVNASGQEKINHFSLGDASSPEADSETDLPDEPPISACFDLPASMNGDPHPDGCPGAVRRNGEPSSTYCAGGDPSSTYPWWADCCEWTGSECVAKDAAKESARELAKGAAAATAATAATHLVSEVTKKPAGAAVPDALDRDPTPSTAAGWQQYLDNSCTAWAGLPDEGDVKPMSCGALVYLHIGKPAGNTIGSFLKSETKETQINGRSKGRKHAQGRGHRSFKAARLNEAEAAAAGPVDAAADMSVLMSRAQYYSNYSFFELTRPDTEPDAPLEQWDVFKELQSTVLDTPQPRVVVQMHDWDGVGLGLGLWETHLQQWRTKLEGQGCELRLTTALRKGSDRLRSDWDHSRKTLPKNRALLFLSKGRKGRKGAKDVRGFCDFARLNSNTQTKFLVAGGNAQWPKEYHRLEPAADANLMALARKTLSEMFMVGRTEELGKFMTRLNLALGLPGNLTVPAEKQARGETKDWDRAADREIGCMRDGASVDDMLYGSYCRKERAAPPAV